MMSDHCSFTLDQWNKWCIRWAMIIHYDFKSWALGIGWCRVLIGYQCKINKLYSSLWGRDWGSCSLAWRFWRYMIKLVVLYYAVLPPPLKKTLALAPLLRTPNLAIWVNIGPISDISIGLVHPYSIKNIAASGKTLLCSSSFKTASNT